MKSQTTRPPRPLVGVLCASTFLLTFAAEAQDREVSFIACPIARDAGPDADLCFVAEYQGKLIALVNPPDWGNPQLLHRVLIEGVMENEPGTCGALKFDGRASVLTEVSRECDDVLPYDRSFKGVAGGVFNNGSAAERGYAQALAARVARDPAASIEPAIIDPPPMRPPMPPFGPRQLVITYPFDSTRGSGPDMVKLRELAEYSRISKATHVEIVGYRAVSRLSDGSTMTEQPELAQLRAQKIAHIMIRLGVDARTVSVRWRDEAVAGSTHADWRNRKVEVTVTPGPAT